MGWWVVVLSVAAVVGLLTLDVPGRQALIVTLIVVLSLSVVVVTGYVGHFLGPTRLRRGGRIHRHRPGGPGLALPAHRPGTAAATVVGVLVGLPALRVRA